MRGLNKLYYLSLDIKGLEEEIKSIAYVGGVNYSGMPHSSGAGDPTFNIVLKKEKLIERLNKKKERYIDELERIEDIIDTIEDIEVRTIARMRFIKCMKWEDIGEIVHLDRTVCSKKLRKYLKNMNME